MLSLCGVSKRYGARCALDALSVELPRGQFVALLGPNGAGKSTLFQLLTGLLAPTAGRIRVAGFDLATQARQALARIGVVFQPL
ncbi:MAG TPA: ATP-binding cassette domain-containing protein, partial [Albitalea sp.]